MKLPTRVRAHQVHPLGVYELRFDGLPLIWSVAAEQVIPGLPFLPNVDHWYVDRNGPPPFSAGQAASLLEINQIAAPSAFPTVAGLIDQTHGPMVFTSPAEVPAGGFQPLGSMPALQAFVASSDQHGFFDQEGKVKHLALIFLKGASGASDDFRVAWLVSGDPGCAVRFGDRIIKPGTKFPAVAHGASGHPYQWSDPHLYVIP